MNTICLATTVYSFPKTTLLPLRPSTPLLPLRPRLPNSTLSTPPVHSISLPIRAFSLIPVAAVGAGGGGEGGGSGGVGGGGDSGDNGEVDPKDEGAGGMSMSQKLTLAYAALVGAGGVMGYIKSGSTKSAIAGGSSALLLYIVYTMLPAKPVLASSLGLGISGALLAVMGSRFKNSMKVFPAGVVSIVSLIMVGGYIHGIMRSMHA